MSKEKVVKIHLLSQSEPQKFIGIKNTYTKDGMYCIMLIDEVVYKYPMVNIFRVIETYGE